MPLHLAKFITMNSKTLLFFAGFSLSLIGLSCGGDAPTSNKPSVTVPNNGASNNNSIVADKRPAIYLDGIYATSSAANQRITNLLDSDLTNTWSTQAGAGPDEGLMLLFSDRDNVKANQIEITSASGVANVQVYVNGHVDAQGKSGEKIVLTSLKENEALHSVYLRFMSDGQETTNERKEENKTIKTSAFPAAASIALKQINLYNAQGDALNIVAPKAIKGTFVSSSTLAPESAYSGANLFDARKEFVWVEGNKTTLGEGETMTFSFETPVNISALQIWNGYQRSDSHYASNARLKNFDFGATGGLGKTYTLADRKAGQKIDLAAAEQGNSFTLKIKDGYKGTKFNDLAISDILFFDGAQPFVLTSDLPEKYATELRKKATATPLESMLNRRIKNTIESPGVKIEQSIIFRSDGTFVLYVSENYDGAANAETIADGNWEIVDANQKTAKVKVFGKWYDVSQVQDYYKGSGTKEITKIFNDVLTIEGDAIKGGRKIGTFYK
jgi:hypothetical protein